MPCWKEMEDDEGWRNGPSDEDDDDDEYENEDDDEPTVPCPHCRREVHEDSQRCPYCEKYISREDSPPARKPWWFIVGFIACMYVMFRWVFW